MSQTIQISATEQGVVRVFAVDLPASELENFTRSNGTWPLRDALGAEALNVERIEIFDVSDLSGMGLSAYLEEGQGVKPEELAPLRAQLDSLKGTVMVLPSSALAGVAQTLEVKAPLRLVATLNEDRPPVEFDTLPDETAKAEHPPLTPPAPSDAAMSGRVAMIALLVIAVLTAVLIWIAA